jgi:hypothetical protein
MQDRSPLTRQKSSCYARPDHTLGQSQSVGDVRIAADCVAKLKNELTAKFRAAPVAPAIWQSNASQRAYEGCRLKIGLIM